MAHAFIQAKHYVPGGNGEIDRIVMHRMQAPEKGETAEAVARYFQRGTVKASAHDCIDNNSVVVCVKDADLAYHAPPSAHSIGMEHAGYEAEGSWTDDAYSNDTLKLSAMRCAERIKILKAKGVTIPVRWLDVPTLRATPRAKGLTSHYNVSRAFGKSTHWDGQYFPVEPYLAMVRVYLGASVPAELPPTLPAPIIYHDNIEKEDTMDYTLGPLDENGNGQWFTNVPMTKFKSVQSISPVRPYADKRYPRRAAPGEAPECFPAEDNGMILVSVTGGVPKGEARLFLTVAQ